MSEDPWKHRSEGMKCHTCMWYAPKKPTVFMVAGLGEIPRKPEAGKIVVVDESTVSKVVRKSVGRCRRHAPTMNGYPVVFEDDWCGDHKLDETRI